MSVLFSLFLLIAAVHANPEGPNQFSYHPGSGIGPADWGTIQTFETCGTGEAQSPIDLPPSATIASLSDGPETHMSKTVFKFERTTENFELHCEHDGECGFSIIDGKRFNIVNMHFHSPSEHKLGGEQFPLEAHMVHRSASGELAVISTLFRYPRYLPRVKRGRTAGRHQVIERTWKQCEKGKQDIFVNMAKLIGSRGYVSYTGSLTTPPCTEGVKWFIAQTVPKISPDEVERYVALTEKTHEFGNNRPTQPLHERVLTAYVRN